MSSVGHSCLPEGRKLEHSNTSEPKLKRAIGLFPLVLYGLGVTIGAGIYVLVGETAGRAGIYAPSSFLLAAFVMAFSAASFAEFSGRVPQSAGEAAYVNAAFGRNWLTILTGGSIILSALVAAAAIAKGCAGYLGLIIPASDPVLLLLIVGLMGLVAAWGIRESVTFAGILTLLEVFGLLVIIVAGIGANPSVLMAFPAAIPPLNDGAAMATVFGASLIAFFAFIGFDDVVNIVEETIDPARIMPWAIGITLVTVTILYCLVSMIALDVLPLDELAGSRAPIGLLFERLTGFPPLAITLIAVFATLNGIVIQIIMAARVVYGMASRGHLPKVLGKIHPATRTPLLATAIITSIILVLALFVRLDQLAEWTSQIILAIFCLVNLALIRVKIRGDVPPPNIFTVPVIIPVLGAITSFCLLAGSLVI